MPGSLCLVVVRRVFFLQVAGIGQHHGTQLDGRLRGIDRPVKPLLHQPRNPAAVIEMRVRENDSIDFARRDWSVLPVAVTPLFRTLKQTAVDQDLKSLRVARVGSGIDEMFRAGHSAGSAEKLDVGQDFPPVEVDQENLPRGQRREVRLQRLKTSCFSPLQSAL